MPESEAEKISLPLLLVTIPKNEREIYHLKHVASVVVNVESQRQQTMIRQCLRCQKFDHAQSRCRASPRCVKCAGAHLSSECKKSIKPYLQSVQIVASHTRLLHGLHTMAQAGRRKEIPDGPAWSIICRQTQPAKTNPGKIVTFFLTTSMQCTRKCERLLQSFEMFENQSTNANKCSTTQSEKN